MWVLMSMWALAAPHEPEEIVVYDQRAMWDGTRFAVDSEQAMSTGAQLGATDHGSFTSPAWQFQMVFACELAGRRRAACTIEDAAIRASTIDLWQRPSDLERIDTILHEMRQALVGTQVDVSFDRHGGLTRADLRDAPSDTYVMNVMDLATRVLGGVALPEGALVEDAVWGRQRDQLLRMPGTVDTVQSGTVNHFGNHLAGWYIVQTIGEASMNVFVLPVQDRTLGEQTQPKTLQEFSRIHESEQEYGTLRMKAVSAYDSSTGIVEERVFSVQAGSPRPFWHTGAVRRLSAGEQPALGATHQVAYPYTQRLNVAPWESMARIELPSVEESVMTR